MIRRLTESDFGPVIRRLLCEIAGNPAVGESFRATVVEARRDEVRAVIERGMLRGDLRPSTDPEIATELLVGSTYFRMLFGGSLDEAFGEKIVDALLTGYGSRGFLRTDSDPTMGRRRHPRAETARPG